VLVRNPEFVRFSGRPPAALYRAQPKGKVVRPVRYLGDTSGTAGRSSTTTISSSSDGNGSTTSPTYAYMATTRERPCNRLDRDPALTRELVASESYRLTRMGSPSYDDGVRLRRRIFIDRHTDVSTVRIG
jgi:hypothetical protein